MICVCVWGGGWGGDVHIIMAPHCVAVSGYIEIIFFSVNIFQIMLVLTGRRLCNINYNLVNLNTSQYEEYRL